MKNVLEVKNLSKVYPTFSLRDVNFSIPCGMSAGFVGLNGQGKTTTIRSILGLLKKDNGSIKILEKDMDRESKEIYQEIGVVFDEGYFYDNLTMRQMRSLIEGGYKNFDREEYKSLMKRFDLKENNYIKNLSKGMKMKFALSLAMSHHAKFLIMDEPTSGLDPLIRRELLDILREYMERDGLGVLYSTHITSDLENFSDLIIMIHDGKIVFNEDKDTLLEEYRIVKGDIDSLTDENKKYLMSLKKSSYNFSAITRDVEKIRESIREAVFEKATIEDIMIANAEELKC